MELQKTDPLSNNYWSSFRKYLLLHKVWPHSMPCWSLCFSQAHLHCSPLLDLSFSHSLKYSYFSSILFNPQPHQRSYFPWMCSPSSQWLCVSSHYQVYSKCVYSHSELKFFESVLLFYVFRSFASFNMSKEY